MMKASSNVTMDEVAKQKQGEVQVVMHERVFNVPNFLSKRRVHDGRGCKTLQEGRCLGCFAWAEPSTCPISSHSIRGDLTIDLEWAK